MKGTFKIQLITNQGRIERLTQEEISYVEQALQNFIERELNYGAHIRFEELHSFMNLRRRKEL